MADIADNAQEYLDLMMYNFNLSRIPEQAKYYKVCRNCEEPTPDGHAFCDEDCRDDFEKRNKGGLIWLE